MELNLARDVIELLSILPYTYGYLKYCISNNPILAF